MDTTVYQRRVLESLVSIQSRLDKKPYNKRSIDPDTNTPFRDKELDLITYILSMSLFLNPGKHNYTNIHDICGPNATEEDINLYCSLQTILTWGLNDD